jgi:Hypothetical protein NE1300
MNKLLLTAAAVAAFMINSPAMAGDNAELQDLDKMSTAERALKGKTAQSILNEMACKDKESGDQVKDSTDGTMHTCP